MGEPMSEDKRFEVVKMFNEVVDHLDAVAGRDDVGQPYRHLGRAYWEISKTRLEECQHPDFDVNRYFGEDALGKFKTRCDNLSMHAREADWKGILRESYEILLELPGKPGWRPPTLPPPPGDDQP
jgi:hypothetical protein